MNAYYKKEHTMTKMLEYWEDRLTEEQHKQVVKALEQFRRGLKNNHAQNYMYDLLTSMGVLAEEANEIIKLELAN